MSSFQSNSCNTTSKDDSLISNPLWMSLYTISTTSLAINSNTVAGVPATHNLRPIRGMGDNAEYWVNVVGEPFTFKFPVTIDLEGQFDHTGPYFNLPCTGVSMEFLSLTT
jgi:hypothetical protein